MPDLFGRPCSQVTIASAVPPDNTILPSRRTRWRRRYLQPASQSICYSSCNTAGCALSVRSSEENEENGSAFSMSNNVVTRSTCALQGVPSLSTRRGGQEKLRSTTIALRIMGNGFGENGHGTRPAPWRREGPPDPIKNPPTDTAGACMETESGTACVLQGPPSRQGQGSPEINSLSRMSSWE